MHISFAETSTSVSSSGSVDGSSSESISIVLRDSWYSSSTSVNCCSKLSAGFSGVSMTMSSASSSSNVLWDGMGRWTIDSGCR